MMNEVSELNIAVGFNHLQMLHDVWLKHNFPNQPKHHGILGAVEEIGELAHAFLKLEQGIRHTPDECRAMMEDAIGDIVIFLTSFCNSQNIVMSDAVVKAEKEVFARDWKKYPKNGRNE
jgi:NTP pyrophosphatase (non-canonical NTP hydrolase)